MARPHRRGRPRRPGAARGARVAADPRPLARGPFRPRPAARGRNHRLRRPLDARVFEIVRTSWSPGMRAREARTGRSGHEHPPFAFFSGLGASDIQGEVHAPPTAGQAATAWWRRSSPTDGARSSSGTRPAARPCPGPASRPPALRRLLGRGAQRRRRRLPAAGARDRLPPGPTAPRPRPVHYNCWEAVYFDHDLAASPPSPTRRPPRRRALRARRRLVRLPRRRHLEPRRLARRPAKMAGRSDAADRARAPPRHALRPLGRARDGQPPQRPLPRPSRLGARPRRSDPRPPPARSRPSAGRRCATTSSRCLPRCSPGIRSTI